MLLTFIEAHFAQFSGELLLALKVAAVRAEALLSPDLHVEHSQSAIIVQRVSVQRSLLKKTLTDTRVRGTVIRTVLVL